MPAAHLPLSSRLHTFGQIFLSLILQRDPTTLSCWEWEDKLEELERESQSAEGQPRRHSPPIPGSSKYGHVSASSASPGRLLEMQILRPCRRNSDFDACFGAAKLRGAVPPLWHHLSQPPFPPQPLQAGGGEGSPLLLTPRPCPHVYRPFTQQSSVSPFQGAICFLPGS